MVTRFLFVIFIGVLSSACSSASSKSTKGVKPRYHHGYYKKHIYHKNYHVGRIHFRLFEKQGVKTVKKN